MLFSKAHTFIVDFESVSDPRITRFLELGLVSGRLLAPRPPSPEKDPGDDHRSRRAWEAIGRLRKVKNLIVKLDSKLLQRDALLEALRRHKATLITVNNDLKADCNGLSAVSAADVYDLFKPIFLPGAELRVRVSKRGKDKSEGIGYLEGGVKVVVDDGAKVLGQEIDIVVKGALETDVGQVLFARQRFSQVS